MTTNINPGIVTYKELPTQEAVKASEMVNRYMYWMSNQINLKKLINAFGDILANHYWQKIINGRNKYGNIYDCNFWYELDTENRQKLMHYIMRTGYKAK